MSPAKLILSSAALLFVVIGGMAIFKGKGKSDKRVSYESVQKVQEIPVYVEAPKPVPKAVPVVETKPAPIAVQQEKPVPQKLETKEEQAKADLPDADLIGRLFALDSSKLPIVETVTYSSRVPWLKGRPAWIADYATYYSTSRHFIARSLNRKPDYFTQKVGPGDKFNVFRKDKDIRFHLLIDLTRCKMWVYYFDAAAGERVLLKTYKVGIGRKDAQKASGYLTPTGKYTLGSKIAIYKPGSMGYFQDKKIEMIRVFGTRWIPFDQEVEGCSESSRGYGIHGSPWRVNAQGELVEDRDRISKDDSDGCIRLNSEDMEELFAIIITKPTTVELVKDFHDAILPGVERKL